MGPRINWFIATCIRPCQAIDAVELKGKCGLVSPALTLLKKCCMVASGHFWCKALYQKCCSGPYMQSPYPPMRLVRTRSASPIPAW